MSELTEISRAAARASDESEPIWLATVMRVQGSAYRHAGARLLFSEAGALAGSVSGGCLEAGLVRKGPWLARERPVCVRFDGSREANEDERPRGTGCDGIVDILLERARVDAPFEPLVLIDDCLRRERRAVLITVFESSDPSLPVGSRLALSEGGSLSSSLVDDEIADSLELLAHGALHEARPANRVVHAEGFQALLEVFEPPPHLFVFGSGPDVLPVVALSLTLGLGVTVCEPNPRHSVRERFAANADLHLGDVASALPKVQGRRTPLAVVMSHHYPTDCAALAMLLDSPAVYIGMLGPQRRTQRMLDELFPGSAEREARNLGRVRAPIGLDLGAETAPQIALSVVAEMQAVLARASAEPLSRRAAHPIHVPVESAVATPLRLVRTA